MIDIAAATAHMPWDDRAATRHLLRNIALIIERDPGLLTDPELPEGLGKSAHAIADTLRRAAQEIDR